MIRITGGLTTYFTSKKAKWTGVHKARKYIKTWENKLKKVNFAK